jgi:hypothetical protein
MEESTFLFFHQPRFIAFFVVVFGVYWLAPAVGRGGARRRCAAARDTEVRASPRNLPPGHGLQ